MPDAPAAPPATGRALRFITLLLWLLFVSAILYFAFATPVGNKLLHHPHALREDARAFVHNHRLSAPLVFILLYALAAAGGLPIWWLQAIAGFVFGLYRGVGLCVVAATLASVVCVSLSRFLFADYFEQYVEGKMDKLKALDEKLGHNGFLTVMVIRMMHVMPFGLSNYAIGLFHISMRDVILATILGNIPAATFSVTAGYNPRLFRTAAFWTVVSILHLVLLAPILLRYLKPEWFKRIGVE